MTQPLPSVKEEMQPEHIENILLANNVQKSRLDLRQGLIQLRKQTSLETRQRWDSNIEEQLLASDSVCRSQILGVFSPIRSEPNLSNCYQRLQQSGIQLALPLVQGKDQALAFVKWAPGDAMDKDEFGVLIPRSRDHFITPDTLLIPCVGFNSSGFRLGYGGGYYDRTLAQLTQVHSIGVAYQLARCEFTAEIYDIPMKEIITEKIE
jgi:5-formyltetrahydrofolate cyclo-ligase